MELKDIRIFSISDLHIGHPRVKSDVMYINYINYLNDNLDIISKCDVFLIDGDITDSLLYTNSPEYKDLIKLMLAISNMCSKYNLILIYLDGTPSHEMNQIGNVIYMVKETYPKLELYHHTSIEYNHITKLGLRYIAVPDQSAVDDNALYTKVTTLLRKNNLSKVDFIFTHTQYEEAVLYPTVGVKSTALWSNLVNYYIINGHIHYHSIRDSVVTVGALDFHHHGDEELKGGVYVQVKNYIKSVKHIPTKHYTKFKTIIVRDENIKSTIDTIYKLFNKETVPYFIKVIGDLPADVVKKIKQDKPLLRLTVVRPKTKNETIIDTEVIKQSQVNSLELTPSNICDLIKEELGNSYTQEIGDLIKISSS